jgi:amidase
MELLTVSSILFLILYTLFTNTLVLSAMALSGEPMASQLSGTYGKLLDQYTASQIAEVNVGIRKWRKEYMDYWNSTSKLTGTGRPVEAVIAPLAPFAAARPNMYKYYGTF